jgi:NAD kinase
MEIENLELKELKKYLKNKKVYIMLGNTNKEQYASASDVKNTIKTLAKTIEKNSIFLYFGEVMHEDNLDIGYAINELQIRRSDLEFILIKHEENDYVPEFVSKLFCFEIKTTKKRGLNSNTKKPLGTTKFWFDINKTTKIEKIFILGGDNVVLEEYKLAKELEIPCDYFPVKRKFNEDGKTIIKKNAPISEKVGPTYQILQSENSENEVI